MKKIICLVLFLALASSPAFAARKSRQKTKPRKSPKVSIESLLDKVTYFELEISAITTDMYVYGWMPEEKKKCREAALKACGELDRIKRQLNSLPFPEKLSGLKRENTAVLDKLRRIYSGIEEKKPEDISKAFASFKKLYTQYARELEKAWEKYGSKIALPDNFDPGEEEVKLIRDPADKESYSAAMKFMKEKKYARSYEELTRLKEKYANTPFGDCLLLRLSDCLLMRSTDMDREESLAVKEGLSLLTEITNGEGYSPVLYEAFYKWRTVYQEKRYGMSSTSEIPNREYNAKRWQILQRIRKYSEKKPDDQWAKAQANLVMDLPNIEREGGEGNDNLHHWELLYNDMNSGTEAEGTGPSAPPVPFSAESYRLDSSVLN